MISVNVNTKNTVNILSILKIIHILQIKSKLFTFMSIVNSY